MKKGKSYVRSMALKGTLGDIISVGVIEFSDFNSATWETKEIDIVFTNKKPKGWYVERLFFVNSVAFTCDTGSYTVNTIESIAFVDKENINTKDVRSPKSDLGDIAVRVVLSGDNQRNWETGAINVFAQLIKYPEI